MSLSYEKATGRDPETSYSLGDVVQVMGQVRQAIESVIEGKRSSVDLALVVLLAEGHLLVEDVPGRRQDDAGQGARAARSPARSAGSSSPPTCCPPTSPGSRCSTRRPGTSSSSRAASSPTSWSGDEINRASPKTQSALLESMEERQVSVDGTTYLLETPVHGRRHPEPDRDGGHLSPPRGAAGPVHGPDPDGLPDAERRAGHARLARLVRPAGRPAAGDRRRHDPRPGRRGEDRLRQPGGQALPGPDRQRHPQLPGSAARRLAPGHPAAAPRQPGLRRPVRPRLRQPRRHRRRSASRCWPTGCCRRPTLSWPGVRSPTSSPTRSARCTFPTGGSDDAVPGGC